MQNQGTSKRFRAVVAAIRCSTLAFISIIAAICLKDVDPSIVKECFKWYCILIGGLFTGYGASRLATDKKIGGDKNGN